MKHDPILDAIVAIVRKHLPDPSYRVFLFGSRPAGFAQKFSDYDIGIMGNKPVDAVTRVQIEADLENSSIPYFVDVVDFFQTTPVFQKVALAHMSYL